MASAVLPPVNKAPDLLQRSSIFPKRRAPVSGGPTRIRFAKPRPNINALVNKTTKEVPPQEEEKISVPQEEISKASEVSKDATASSIETTDENLCASRKEEIVSTSCEQAPEVDEVSPSNLESSTIPEKEPLDDPPPCVVESVEITPPRPKSVSDAALEKEISTAALNKTPECPTLKSILNSPRKKITTKKAHERRKRFANGTETPPRSEMTMTDLIYYNPSGTPMKSTTTQATVVDDPLPSDKNAAPVEDEKNSDSLVSLVPKVIINENGEIIIDESSLVIRRKETVDTSIAPVIEIDNTTYSSFRKKTSKQWTNKETAKFYKALSLVGTDFSLMENIFIMDGKVTRTRRELKLKFKREERQNTELVHQAMYETQTYDISVLDDNDSDDVSESSEIEDEFKKSKSGTKSDKTKESPKQPISGENLAENNPTDPVVNKKNRGRKKKEKDDLPENTSSSFLGKNQLSSSITFLLFQRTVVAQLEEQEISNKRVASSKFSPAKNRLVHGAGVR